MIDLLHACARAPGTERVLVPGEIERETEARRRVEGIPINAILREELAALARELGEPAPFQQGTCANPGELTRATPSCRF